VLPKGVNVDIDQHFGRTGGVIGPEVVGHSSSEVIVELIVFQGGTVTVLVVADQERLGCQFGTNALIGDFGAVVEA
jgi:hypothetical protein